MGFIKFDLSPDLWHYLDIIQHADMFEQRVKNVHGTKGEDREHVERGSGVIECLACGTAMDIIEQAWIDGIKKNFKKS